MGHLFHLYVPDSLDISGMCHIPLKINPLYNLGLFQSCIFTSFVSSKRHLVFTFSTQLANNQHIKS